MLAGCSRFYFLFTTFRGILKSYQLIAPLESSYKTPLCLLLNGRTTYYLAMLSSPSPPLYTVTLLPSKINYNFCISAPILQTITLLESSCRTPPLGYRTLTLYATWQPYNHSHLTLYSYPTLPSLLLPFYAALYVMLAPLRPCLARAHGQPYPNKLGINTSFYNSPTTTRITILRPAMESDGSVYLPSNSTGSTDYVVLCATLPYLRLYVTPTLSKLTPTNWRIWG